MGGLRPPIKKSLDQYHYPRHYAVREAVEKEQAF